MTDNKKRRRAVSAHRKVKTSVSKNRKDMRRPAKKLQVALPEVAQTKTIKVKTSPKKVVIQPKAEQIQKDTKPTDAVKVNFDMTRVNFEMKRRSEIKKQPTENSLTSQEIKEREIRRAISVANRELGTRKRPKYQGHYKKIGFGLPKIALAMLCAAAAVFAIVYFVNSNAPDIPLKVAAMQTGIDAHYPGYIPRDYSLADVTSENGKITMNFKNSSTGDAFSIVEENTSWTANDLYSKFVKPTYGENYVVITEDNFNIYISGSNAVWVKDGILYKITTTSGSLTKKQISTIASKL